MIRVKHRFIRHHINRKTETLIIGTFNPDVIDNPADFFYGRSQNHLWKILPAAFNEKNLKNSPKSEKLKFIKNYKIDFIDLITEIEIDEGEETNYSDKYIDKKATNWKDVISEINNLKQLKRVCFTRKTFSGIQNIKVNVESIQRHCNNNKVNFKSLITPARFYSGYRQKEWTKFLNSIQE